jgi:hypothetical protein
MKRYVEHYRNQDWLYAVYRSEAENDFLLVAVVPAIGWWELAVRLEPEEVEALRRSEGEFTTVVNEILKGRHWPKYKMRRVEHLMRRIGPGEIELEEPADAQ